MRVFKTPQGRYKVESTTPHRFYLVDTRKNMCSCADFLYRRRPKKELCKHLTLVHSLEIKQQEQEQKQAEQSSSSSSRSSSNNDDTN